MTVPTVLQSFCRSFFPGHDVHYIQANHSLDEPPEGEGVAIVAANGWITVELGDGSRRRLWNHDPHPLAIALARADGRVVLRINYVLAVRSGDGHFFANVASEPSPCGPE